MLPEVMMICLASFIRQRLLSTIREKALASLLAYRRERELILKFKFVCFQRFRDLNRKAGARFVSECRLNDQKTNAGNQRLVTEQRAGIRNQWKRTFQSVIFRHDDHHGFSKTHNETYGYSVSFRSHYQYWRYRLNYKHLILDRKRLIGRFFQTIFKLITNKIESRKSLKRIMMIS